ncbi:hypothetical protein JOC75_001012 [Metabacillus crassostreae]|nr:hypothetical protein [Metabacillus crassostreae]
MQVSLTKGTEVFSTYEEYKSGEAPFVIYNGVSFKLYWKPISDFKDSKYLCTLFRLFLIFQLKASEKRIVSL